MRPKLWLFITLLVVIVPCYTLTPATADQGYEYIVNINLSFANLNHYTVYPNECLSSEHYCRPFYAYPNDTILLYSLTSYFSGSNIPVQEISYHQAKNGTLYLISTTNLDHFWRGESHEKLVFVYEPYDLKTYSIVVPSQDLYVIFAVSNYTGGSQYNSFGTTTGHIYRIPYGYGGNNSYYQNFYNFSTVNNQNTTYNTENTSNVYNTQNTTHNTYNNVPPLGIAMGIGGLVCLVLMIFLRRK